MEENTAREWRNDPGKSKEPMKGVFWGQLPTGICCFNPRRDMRKHVEHTQMDLAGVVETGASPHHLHQPAVQGTHHPALRAHLGSEKCLQVKRRKADMDIEC